MSLRVTPVMSVLCSVSASSSFCFFFVVYKEKFSLKEDGHVLFDLVKCPNPHQKKSFQNWQDKWEARLTARLLRE